MEPGLCPRCAQVPGPGTHVPWRVLPESCCPKPGVGGLPAHCPWRAGHLPQSSSASRPGSVWPRRRSGAMPGGMSPHCHLVVTARAPGNSRHLVHLWLLQAQVWTQQGFLTSRGSSPDGSFTVCFVLRGALSPRSCWEEFRRLWNTRAGNAQTPNREAPLRRGHGSRGLPASPCSRSLPSEWWMGFPPSGVEGSQLLAYRTKIRAGPDTGGQSRLGGWACVYEQALRAPGCCPPMA